ncbi:hypothetical protein BDV12DRAFT_2737 [Aspergillus spectabilis]
MASGYGPIARFLMSPSTSINGPSRDHFGNHERCNHSPTARQLWDDQGSWQFISGERGLKEAKTKRRSPIKQQKQRIAALGSQVRNLAIICGTGNRSSLHFRIYFCLCDYCLRHRHILIDIKRKSADWIQWLRPRHRVRSPSGHRGVLDTS